ncbi:MAG: KpsF/GutQ family sugar-phosphate isomerase [Phycisphaerales bacterium]|nr:KpsF/GutQ family sugar-phosphate isomerase [Phycisphaerales bacterium]
MKRAVIESPEATPVTTVDDASRVLSRAREIMAREAEAIQTAGARLGASFVEAFELILSSPGRVAVTGMGKAGNIGAKIQATLASTGTPAYTLHPVEALHGDLGMVCSNDVVLALSKSGQTQELAYLIPKLSKLGCKIVLLTGNLRSKCAALSDVVIDIGNTPEACPLGMAPSASTAAMLAVGDALALTLMERKNIRPERYAEFHPGGALGRSLMRVHEIMRVGDDCPRVHPDETLLDYYHAVQRAPRRAGAAMVVDDGGRLTGIFTHGDLARLLGESIHPSSRLVREVMTRSPKHVRQDALVSDAMRLMEAHRIDELPVVDDANVLVGMIDVQDVLAEGYATFDHG